MDEKAKPVAWLHEIKEPEGHQMAMYSQFETNPWAHWVSAHLGQCEYKCSPLYPASAIAALEAERDALRADAERFREILEAVVRELPGYRRDDGNAPGHGHRIPGIWDEHNGAKTGKPCAWCKTWSLARAAIAAKGAQS